MKKNRIFSLPTAHEPLIPMAFGFDKKTKVTNRIILAGDVGGTKTHLSLFEIKEEQLTLLIEKLYHTKAYTSLLELIQEFKIEKSKKSTESV